MLYYMHIVRYIIECMGNVWQYDGFVHFFVFRIVWNLIIGSINYLLIITCARILIITNKHIHKVPSVVYIIRNSYFYTENLRSAKLDPPTRIKWKKKRKLYGIAYYNNNNTGQAGSQGRLDVLSKDQKGDTIYIDRICGFL